MDRQTAELQIAAILEELEKATGTVVGDIGLHTIDIGTVLDPDQRLVQVRISSERLPGNNWQTS